MKLHVIATLFPLLAAAAFPAAAQDAAAGAKVFRRCMSCHNAEKPQNRAGPHLVGIVGRPIASVEGYRFSDAMVDYAAEAKIWDEATLAAYLADPAGVVKGTRMRIAGLSEQNIADVIAYLKNPAAAK